MPTDPSLETTSRETALTDKEKNDLIEQFAKGESQFGKIDFVGADPLFEDAARLIVASQIGATSLLHCRLKLGHNRSGRLMDQLEASGIAFLRVMHLVIGDYILIGPEKFENINISRSRDNELWFLSKEKGSKPVKFGVKMIEGMAISKKSMKISFSQVHAQSPDLPEGASRLVVADLDISGGTPKVLNQKTVFTSPDTSCVLEAADFYDNDSKMTFTCYEPEGLASVMTIDLKTNAVLNESKAPGTYNECEGIFPDGKYTLVEGDRQCDWLGGKRGHNNIDLWKLKLDGTGKDFVRLTNFNDYEGGKASNQVVSTDGKYMSFQFANTADPAGVGYGILLYTFK
jgi:hypothetical protein